MEQIVAENCQFLRGEKRMQLVEVLKRCLKMDPKERGSPSELLECDLFVRL